MSNKDPRVFIFRHGETEWTKAHRATGMTEVELTEAGEMQVSSAAAKLVGPANLLNPHKLLHVFVSPRVRAKKTFELLLAPFSTVLTGKITYTADIAEWDYGNYEGCTNEQIRDSRKKRGLDRERDWDIFEDGCEGGETPQEATERLDRLIAQIKEIQKPYVSAGEPGDVLVVAHGLILRCFWKRWLGYRIATPLRVKFEPGEIAVLSYKHGEPAFHLGVPLPC